jgi:hypothetical protein
LIDLAANIRARVVDEDIDLDVTSAAKPLQRRPVACAIAAAVSSQDACVRAVIAISAPASASAVAMVRPSPREPPVTSATLPSSRNESSTDL